MIPLCWLVDASVSAIVTVAALPTMMPYPAFPSAMASLISTVPAAFVVNTTRPCAARLLLNVPKLTVIDAPPSLIHAPAAWLPDASTPVSETEPAVNTKSPLSKFAKYDPPTTLNDVVSATSAPLI